MFESNMLDNIKSMKQWNNPWRDLVTPQFKAFLDSLSKDSKSKQDITENEEEL